MVRYVCMFFHNFLHNITNIPSVIITYVCYSEADRRTHIINMINIYRMHTNYYCIAKSFVAFVFVGRGGKYRTLRSIYKRRARGDITCDTHGMVISILLIHSQRSH